MTPLNRRRFLKSAALLGAATVLPAIACSPAATPTAAPPTAAKPAASAPTTAPQAALAAPTVVTAPRQLKQIRIISGTGNVVDPALLGQTIGMELGFYAEEGVEVEIIPASGSGGAGTMIAAGQGEVANTNAPQFILAAAQGQDYPLVTVYNWTRDIHWLFAVMDDSSYKSFKDLKGAKIGIPNQGDSSLPGARAMLRESGLDPDKDVEFIAAGTGVPVVEALRGKRIDAYTGSDFNFGTLENIGLKLRYFELTPSVQDLMGTGIGTHRDLIKNRRQDLVGFLRGMTKGTVFALTNLEEAVKIHWKLYPETKPKGKSEDQALKETMHIVTFRANKWEPKAPKLPRWGEHYPKGWVDFVKVLGADPAKVGDVTRFYTNELVEEVNKYDYEKIKQMAKGYKFKG